MRRKASILLFMGVLLLLSANVSVAQGTVRAVITSEFANVRIIPAIGADVLGSVQAGYVIDPATARSADNIWLRFIFGGEEGWIHTSTLSIINGDINSLPVADPRSIPYGGWDAPRAGLTTATGYPARVTDWLRVRAGPALGYVVLANAPINTTVQVTGRSPSSNWIQVNFDGTLGWVSLNYLEFEGEFSLVSLPIDGVIASSIAPSTSAAEDYIGVLRLMRERIDLAQPSLDTIRAMWTDAALTGRASCTPYPAQPSNINIANNLLAAYYITLEPLQGDFNDAMFNVRYAIDLFIDVCNQPGTVNPVGRATAEGALSVISMADRQFGELRRRLDELIPDTTGVGVGECLFSYGGRVEILPVISLDQLVRDELDSKDLADGFCFDAIEAQSLLFEALQVPGGNANPILVVTSFDNPTSFLGIARGTPDVPLTRLGPISIPETGRYIFIIANDGFPEEEYLTAQFGYLMQ